MRYSFRDPEGRIGAVSNRDSLIYRGLNTGYFSKWAGLWIPPVKYMDYHAYRINGTWLAPGTCDGVEYGDSMTHYFELDCLEVEEEISTAEEFAGAVSTLRVRNVSDDPKAVRTGLEVGVDIREKSRDIGPSEYKVETGDVVEVSTGDRKLVIDPDDEFEVSGNSYLKDHRPGGDHQRCMVPGEIGFRWELQPGEEFVLTVDFRTGEKASEEEIEEPSNLYEGPLDRGFEDAVTSMHNLCYSRSGGGIVAGHPWFQSYWARDTFWALLGLIDAGNFEFAERVLENFAERGLPGKINLEGADENHARSDTYPLYVIAADKLKRHYGSSEVIEKGVKEAIEHLKLEEGVVQHPPEGTWMDTLERAPAVDIQALWLEAAEITGDERASELRKGLQRFVTDGYLKDFLDDDAPRTVNVAVPLMFGQLDENNADPVLEKLNGEFSSRFGARTRSVADPGYDSAGYHTGSVWGLTTGWAAAADLEYGRQRQGENFLERLAETGDMKQPGGFPEVLNAESGEILGCTEQAWSASMLVHTIDSYLLGIEVESPEKIVVDPAEGLNARREKIIGDEKVMIEIEDGDATVKSEEVEAECF